MKMIYNRRDREKMKYDKTYNLRHVITWKRFKRNGTRLNPEKSFLICNRFKEDASYTTDAGNKHYFKHHVNYYNNVMKHKKFLKVKRKINRMEKDYLKLYQMNNRKSIL